MKFSIFGWYFLPYLIKHLEKDGHLVLLNKFSKDVDVCIAESVIAAMYDVYLNLKEIRRNKIKLINFIAEVPIDRKMQRNNPINAPYINLIQTLYNITHRNKILLDRVNYFTPDTRKSVIFNLFSWRVQGFCNTRFRNRIYYQKHYRKFLMNSHLNLSMSKFTQKLVKKFFKLNSKVCYPCVDSDYLLSLPKVKKKYDAVNISTITKRKRQDLFIEASKKLGLDFLILGRLSDKSIRLNCPHFYYSDHNKVMRILNQARFYVTPSEFEGFGITPVEALFLDIPVIASDIFTHKEVLGESAIYFKKNNLEDLVEKMKIIIEGNYHMETSEIKEKYSVQALKKRLMGHIESLF